jgi:ribulose-phosphate 3-epimerase
MNKIAPSILSADFFKLGEELETAKKAEADWIHVDVMDGHFVPPITYGSKIVSDIKKHGNYFCDVHLMVTNPQDQIPIFIKAGSDLINFHFEAAPHGDRLVNQIKEAGILAGVTINPATSVESIKHYLPIVDLILIMSVNPGFGGQKFIPYTLDKVRQLDELRKKNGYKFVIEIDGGVGAANVEEVLKAGVDVVVSGSSFFDADFEAKKKLVKMIHDFKR